MPKIFDRPLEDPRILRLNEDRWFKMHQLPLLWLANTQEGRDFLCIDKSFPVIHEIAKNYIRHHDWMPEGKKWRRVTTSEFRIGAKYANIIRYRWDAWREYLLDYDVELLLHKLPRQYVPKYAIVGSGQAVAYHATLTVYPDYEPESTSVNGYIGHDNGSPWATVHDAADGTYGGDSRDIDILATRDGVGDYRCARGFMLFDTSSLGAGSTVTDGVLSLYGYNSGVDGNAATTSLDIVASTPASNTALTTADYDQVGTTVYATKALSAWSNSGYNDFTLDSNGVAAISKTSVSKFGARIALDTTNTTPPDSGSGINRVSSHGREASGTTDAPKLVVTYTAAAT